MPVHGHQTATRRRSFHEPSYWGILLVAPWLIGFIIFKMAPILATLVLSFTDMYLLEPGKFQFVGVENYLAAIKDSSFWAALSQTMIVAGWVIPLQTVASIAIANLLSQKQLFFKNTLRALFFLPSLIPSTAFMFMWQGFVNPKSGWLTRILLGPFGLQKLNIFAGRNSGQALFILGTLWTIGPGVLILMGAIQSVPAELREAARMDGASRLRSFFALTLPLITPAIFFTLVLNLTGVLGGTLLLDRGYGINDGTSSFDNYIHFALFRLFDMGSAASLAWIFFVLVALLVALLFRTSRYWVYYPESTE